MDGYGTYLPPKLSNFAPKNMKPKCETLNPLSGSETQKQSRKTDGFLKIRWMKKLWVIHQLLKGLLCEAPSCGKCGKPWMKYKNSHESPAFLLMVSLEIRR